jgi:hypothetical protein
VQLVGPWLSFITMTQVLLREEVAGAVTVLSLTFTTYLA